MQQKKQGGLAESRSGCNLAAEGATGLFVPFPSRRLPPHQALLYPRDYACSASRPSRPLLPNQLWIPLISV